MVHLLWVVAEDVGFPANIGWATDGPEAGTGAGNWDGARKGRSDLLRSLGSSSLARSPAFAVLRSLPVIKCIYSQFCFLFIRTQQKQYKLVQMKSFEFTIL